MCTLFSSVIPACPSLSLDNGNVNYTNEVYTVGTIASFTCDTGFHLGGPAMRTCISGSLTWSISSSTCVGK